MILFCYAFVYIQLMCYACLSIRIYTTKLHLMGKKSMILYIIPLLLIYIETFFVGLLGVVHILNNIRVECM